MSTAFDCNIQGACNGPVQDIMIEKTFIHPQFRKDSGNDIALLKLSQPADITRNNIRTICLPLTSESEFSNVKEDSKNAMLISGWGLTCEYLLPIFNNAYVKFLIITL